MANRKEIRERVRRFATLRAAQRLLSDVLPPDETESGDRMLLERMRALDGRVAPREDDLAEIDRLLAGLRARFHEALARAPVHELCAALRRAGEERPISMRALGVELLDGDLDRDETLRLLEAVVTSLACEGPDDARHVVMSPLEALPELARLGDCLASPEDIREATRILERAIARLIEDDAGATRNRVRLYKGRIGLKLFHPEILEVAVAYNAAMGNRIAEFHRAGRRRDGLTETLLGDDRPQADQAARAGLAAPGAIARVNALHSSQLWMSALTFAIAIGCLLLASQIWPQSPVRVVDAEFVATLEPFVESGYVSEGEGRPRFIGTVSSDWSRLDLDARKQVVSQVASRLGEQGVRDVVLLDEDRSLQARHDGATLLWVKPPAPAP